MTDEPLPALEPCPFCGERDNIAVNQAGGVPVVACECGATMEIWTESKTEVIAAWNRRSAGPVREALNEIDRLICSKKRGGLVEIQRIVRRALRGPGEKP